MFMIIAKQLCTYTANMLALPGSLSEWSAVTTRALKCKLSAEKQCTLATTDRD